MTTLPTNLDVEPDDREEEARWLSTCFAQAQYDLVSEELRGWNRIGCYRVFLEMVAQIPDRRSILDIGCGVGGYGAICKKAFPEMSYTGTDISPHMIEFAKQTCPGGTFHVCDFFENELEGYDIVFTGAAIEYTVDPWGAISFLLKNAPNYLVFHRLHITDGVSREFDDLSYCGKHINKMHWNADEVCGFISAERTIREARLWTHGDMLTVVVEPRDNLKHR